MRRFPILMLLAVIACGGDSGTGPDDGGGGNGNVLRATIDGTAWAAAGVTISAAANTSQLPGGLIFLGSSTTQPARGMVINLGRINGPGTYPLGVNTGTNAGGTLTMTLGAASWWTPLNGEAGTITITSMANGRMQGTFSATLGRLAGTGGAETVTVTNGQFNVPINPGYTVPAADNRGSTFTITIDGQVEKGATIVGLGGGTSLIGISASNDQWTISATAGPVDGEGTLPISVANVPVRKIQVIQTSGGLAWGGTQADVGTFTISSVSATRIAGTFNATLAPIGGALGSKTVSGTFDVRTAP